MIGQFVYTRTKGAILLGYSPYESHQKEGYRCVGSTPSLSYEDWHALDNLSNYEIAAAGRDPQNKWLPLWTLYWLPSGALAVGKTTFFDESNTLDHKNHVSHYYIIDHAQAMENSGCMERLFTLPFIDYELNAPRTEQQRTVLRDMVDYDTLEQAGARNVQIMPLKSLLEDHLRIYLDQVRNIVEGTIDSAIHRERQMLCGYDSDADHAEALHMSLMGWIYRLTPKHLRDRVGFAMPFNRMSNSDIVHLTMVPESNVKINPYSQVCSNGLGDQCSGILLGHSYLYADARISGFQDAYGVSQSVIYHAVSEKEELYNSGVHYFSAFLHERIRALYYDSAENENLQAFYDSLYREGWNSGPLLANRIMLELMGWHSGQGCGMVRSDDESRRGQLYAWLEHLKTIADAGAMPQAACADLQELILLKLCSMDQAGPDEAWINALKNMIAAPTRNTVMKSSVDGAATLAGACIGLAAIAVARIWAEDCSKASQQCAAWFGGLEYEGKPVSAAILELLTTPGDARRQERWREAGVSCDDEATVQRINDLLRGGIGAAADIDTYFQNLQINGEPLDQLQTNYLLDGTVQLLCTLTDGWMKTHLPEIDDSLLRQLYQYKDRFRKQKETSNVALLGESMAERMENHCKNILRSQNQNAGMPELLGLKALSYPVDGYAGDPLGQALQPFYRELYDALLPQVLGRLEKAPLGEDLIISAAMMMDLCRDEASKQQLYSRSVNLYESVCQRLLGMSRFTDPILQIPPFVTGRWLKNLHVNGYLRPQAGCRGANVLTLLMHILNNEPISGDLGRVIDREDGSLLQKLLAQMFLDGNYPMRPEMLYGHIAAGTSGLAHRDALVLLAKYKASDFFGYVKWLRDSSHWNDLLELMELLAQSRRLNKLDWENFKRLLLLLRDDYDKRLIPPELEQHAWYCSKELWTNYKVPITEKMWEKKYVIQLEEEQTDAQDPSDDGSQPAGGSPAGETRSKEKKAWGGLFKFGKKKKQTVEYENVNIIDDSSPAVKNEQPERTGGETPAQLQNKPAQAKKGRRR